MGEGVDLRGAADLRLKVVGAWQYMKAPEIWAKMQTTSKGIELALCEFDLNYAVNSNPTSEAITNFKMREAYCYWVDKYFHKIETSGGTFVTNVRAVIIKKWPGTRDWALTNLDDSGLGS